MKKITQKRRLFLAAAMMMLAFITLTSPVSASGIDFLFGRKAAPGSELHALGTTALEQNNGDATYFTNGKGRVLEVRAKTANSGTLRVSVNRVYIPRNYNGCRKSETLYDRLSQRAQDNAAVRAGTYTLIDGKTGWEAYRYGEMIAKALDSE